MVLFFFLIILAILAVMCDFQCLVNCDAKCVVISGII